MVIIDNDSMKVLARLTFLFWTVVFAAGCASVETRLERAKATNTIAAYEEFLKHYPHGPESNEARLALQNLKNQLQQVKDAAERVLPREVKVDVTSVSRFPS